MSVTQVTRRKFIAGVGATVGLAAVPLISAGSKAQAAALHDIPYAYTVQNATAVAKRAYEIYYASGCAEATWWSVAEALGQDATNVDQALWQALPKKLFGFGGGGISGWGTVCGTLNGSAAAIKAVGAPNSIVDAVMMYYADTPLPTRGTEDALAAGGWTPGVMPRPNVPTCIGHTQLCHASVSQWTMMTGFADGGPEQKDRCAKACFDLTFRTITLLNNWKSTGSAPAVALDPTVTMCAGVCHTANGMAPQKAKMACDSCHDETLDHPTLP